MKIANISKSIEACYPDELFQSETLPSSDSDLRCIICYNVMFDSVRCPQDCCFCKSCAEEAIKMKTSCPGCRVPLTSDKLLVNRKLNSMIGELIVVCKHSKQYEDASEALDVFCSPLSSSSFNNAIIVDSKKRKLDEENDDYSDNEQKVKEKKQQTVEAKQAIELQCNWAGRLSDLSNHLKTCEFAFDKCQLCPVRCRRRLLNQHTIDAHKTVICAKCEMTVREDNLSSHNDYDCQKRLQKCYYCKVTFPYDEYESGNHASICDMGPIECPYKTITGCAFICFRKDMPAHTLDSAIHMTGLFSHLLELQNTCDSLSHARCEMVINDIAREIANPLFGQLADFTDKKFFKDESDLCKKLGCLLDLVSPISEDPVLSSISKWLKRNVNRTEKQIQRNREYIAHNLVKTSCSVFGIILSKCTHFSKLQTKYTLFALYGLYYEKSCKLCTKDFQEMHILPFIKMVSLPGYSNPSFIKPAFAALGSCMSCLESSFHSKFVEIVIKVVKILRSFVTANIANVEYMSAVSFVVKSMLSNPDFRDIDVLLESNIMDIFSALLTNHMMSAEVVHNLTSVLPGLANDLTEYSPAFEEYEENKPISKEDENKYEWARLMNTHIAENGLCELLVSVASDHEDETCRESAEEFIDWLLDVEESNSCSCSERIKAVQQENKTATTT